MNIRIIKNILLLLLVFPALADAQSGSEDLRREVRMYNPFKPSLKTAGKINFFPELKDTSLVVPDFRYSINPEPYMPGYDIKTIEAARLQPDPLPRLYNGFLNLGFGNYFSPLGELSISSGRSRNGIAGLYLNHESSYGKIKTEDDKKVYAGYMDNEARLYGARFFRRAALSANIDFNHIRRYAYGADPVFLLPGEPGKDSLKIEYFNPRANIGFYSTRLDSSKLRYDVNLYYDLLYQTSLYYQHMAGMNTELGYDMDIFYAGLDLDYHMTTITNIEDRFRHRVSVKPSISKRTDIWNFKLGLKLTAHARYYDDPAPREYNTKYYLHPDIIFQFSVIPTILNMDVGLDGEYTDNNASEIIYNNPFVINHNLNGLVEPSDDLYTILPTDTQLRVKGGLTGFASENTSYRLRVSYSLFEDMLFYENDMLQGRGFTPLYDNGELLQFNAWFSTKITESISLSAEAAYYDYKMESIEEPWHKPSWDGRLNLEYRLRDKIIAEADIYTVSERYARFGPMSYSSSTDYTVNELPLYASLNIGLEYRYTKILSFWTKLNNIALNRYYEWNFYPSQRFIFMAGFTYSL